jgi:glycosyltransferase involved in cell wall biosynthesis
MKDALALTWFEHRRTSGLCAGLGLELAVLETGRRGVLRYLLLGLRTITLLLRRRPAVLLVQNPSLILGALSVGLRPVLGYRLIVDAHNEAVLPFINRQSWVRRLSRWVVRKADLTIVSNRQLAAAVEQQGGRPFTLADRLPVAPMLSTRNLAGHFNVVLIATFAADEPVEAVLAAVRGTEIDLYVTGNWRKLDPATAQAVPANVHFTGFLAEEEYWRLLQSADAVVDLTLMDNCLVCGAYEGLAATKPMLLSNNTASVELFGDSALYTDNTAPDIRRSLERLRLERLRLHTAAAVKRAELSAAWTTRAGVLAEVLRQYQTGVQPESVV